MFKIFTAIGAIQVISILSSLIRTKYIAIMLGPEGTGIIGIIDQVVQLTAFISAFSLPVASIKFLSKAHSESKEEFIKTYVGFLNTLVVISTTAAIFLFLLVSSPVYLPIGEISKYRNYLYIAVLAIPAMMLGGFLSNVLASAERPKSASILSLIYSLSLTVAVLIGITYANITGFYWASVTSGALVTVSVLLYIRLKLKLPIFIPRLNTLAMLKKRPEVVAFALMLFFASITHSFSFFVARYAILDNQGEAGAGLLHALFAIAISIDMVLTPINGFFLTPKLNRNISNPEKIQLTIDFQKIQVLIMTIIVLPFILFPKLVLLILFSEQFTSISPYLFVFVLAQFIGQMGGAYQSLLIGFDKTKVFSLITCSCWLLFAALSWILIPLWGFWGVAFGFLLSRVLMLFISITYLKANYPIEIPRLNKLLSSYGIALITIAGYVASGYDDFTWTSFLLKSILYLLFVTSLAIFLTRSEKQQLLGLRKKFRY